jgi:RNA polymerase sigma-70 factor (ECF subfamily)
MVALAAAALAATISSMTRVTLTRDAQTTLARTSPVDPRPDAQLVEQARSGSRDAAGVLFDRHWPGAWRLAVAVTGRRDMADDVAQDAFERAFAALHRFDVSRPFGPWLHRIVVNRSLDLVRRERRLVGLDAAGELIAQDHSQAAAGDRALLKAVARLTPQRRVVVVLRYGIGYSPAEIAALLEIPVGTVHSRLARALDDLRDPTTGGIDAERA